MVDVGRERGLPDAPACAACGVALAGSYGWCGNCRAAYCLPCGRLHYCTPTCPANGCLPGFCLRLVTDGALSSAWGLPVEE